MDTINHQNELIRSAKNPRVQALKALQSAKGRKEKGQIAVEGPKLIGEALLAGWWPVYALFAPQKAEGELIMRLQNAGAEIFPAADAALAAASDVRAPQGVIAAFALREAPPMRSPIIALDSVQDPGNLGTILRTALACGFGGALLGEGCADPYSPKGLRSTMGAAFHLPLRSVHLPKALAELQKEGCILSIAAADGEDAFARHVSSTPAILVIGSEGRGVSPGVRALADAVLALPMAEHAESLNAAVAAGVLLYDWYRRGDGRGEGDRERFFS